MVHFTPVSGRKTGFMDKASTPGKMAASTKAAGKIMLCMATVSTCGKTAAGMTVGMRMTRSTAQAPTRGPMADNTVASGKMAGSMAQANTYRLAGKVVKAYGKTANESSGWAPRSQALLESQLMAHQVRKTLMIDLCDSCIYIYSKFIYNL